MRVSAEDHVDPIELLCVVNQWSNCLAALVGVPSLVNKGYYDLGAIGTCCLDCRVDSTHAA